MIFIHGGGWVIGDVDSYDSLCRQIANRATCVVLSVDYRLAPEHPAPAASDDVNATLKWVFQQAASLGIDTDRIAIGGDSAGGGLSASAAIAARDAGLPLRCQILIYPATDQRNLSWQYASRKQNAKVPPLTLSMMKWFSDLYLPDKTLADDWRISPLAVSDLTGVAPALILTGSADTLWDDAKFYTERLESSGVEVMRRSFPGMIHGFINMLRELTAAEESLQTIVLFLQQRLRHRP